MRIRTLFAAALALAIAASAQSPKGWKVRVDRSSSATDPDASGSVKFVSAGRGFHASNPQAAVYWNPSNSVTGNYTLKGDFTLLEPSNHTNFYGLVFGGKDLEGANQTYNYFLVAQDGTFLIKKREGDRTSNVVAKTKSEAVKTPGPDGKSLNQLELRVSASKIDFVVNNSVVHSEPRAALTTDGLYGARVNHFLEVLIEGLELKK